MGGRPDDGLVTAEIITERYPGMGIVLLSSYANGEFIRRFFQHGTAGRGYLLKWRLNDTADISLALDLVRRGQTYSDTSIADRRHRPEPTLSDQLTPRELDVLRYIAAGLTNAAIATSLGIRADQVEYATQAIYTKLGRGPGENRRVTAAIRWLEEHRGQ
jgi:DNA-binding NarL/FixJ family response regulator